MNTETIPDQLGIMAVLHMHQECGFRLTVRGAEEIWFKQDEESRKRIVGWRSNVVRAAKHSTELNQAYAKL